MSVMGKEWFCFKIWGVMALLRSKLVLALPESDGKEVVLCGYSALGICNVASKVCWGLAGIDSAVLIGGLALWGLVVEDQSLFILYFGNFTATRNSPESLFCA